MHNNNQDRIDAYLRSEMSKEERKSFEQDLITDEALRADFEVTKKISETLADRQEKISRIQEWEDEIQKQDKKRISRFISLSVSAAACIAGLFMFISNPSISYDMPSFESEVARGDNTISEIDTLIKDKEYKKALQQTDSLILEYKTIIEEYESLDSLSNREQYLKQNSELDMYELEWRIIHLKLQLRQKKEALKLLEIYKDKEGIYQKEAEELYMKFK